MIQKQIWRNEKITGGLYGALIGDALGVPYEFHAAEELPPYAEIEMTPPAGFRRAHAGVKPGTWSDDGAQALCLLDSLAACGKFDLDDFPRGFWHGIRRANGPWTAMCLMSAFKQAKR